MVGHLRERVQLQSHLVSQNDAGDDVETWTTYATVRARMEPLTASAAERAARETVTRRWRLTIRYRGDVTAAHRVAWGTRLFDIEGAVNPDERRRYTTLDLVEFNAS